MISERKSGVLLHITSLPSYGGIGDFGPAAYGFADFLVTAKQRLWQVLPLNATGYGNSPYSAISAFAGNPLLLSLERLVQDGWLYQGEIQGLAGHEGDCDFDRAFAEKLPLIERAAHRFLQSGSAALRERFEKFIRANADWLDNYVRYVVLKREHEGKCWCDWAEPLKHRDPAALKEFDRTRADILMIERVVQFFFADQWFALKTYCNQRDIEVMGDMAIFVSYDSAEVWANPEIFRLDADLNPIVVSGVPPDYFSATGQRWGNPLYNWEQLKKTDFAWWVKRVSRQMELYDVLRLDHFRGFEACWEISAEEETAINGTWVKAPGYELFEAMRKKLGDPLPLIAEDLGLITPAVDQLRDHFQMPGMRVLQFGFSDRGAHLHLPHKYVPNSVCYTGTHDNNTTLGWWLEGSSEVERHNALEYLGPLAHPHDIVWAMIRAAERSVAALCILPLQDLLHLGSEGRMNTPAADKGNWAWRYHQHALHPDLSTKLGQIVEMTDRDGWVPEPVEDPTVPKPIESLESQAPSEQAHSENKHEG